MAREQWRAVLGYEGWYEVSDRGRVKRVRGGGQNAIVGRILKPDCFGRYERVTLYRDGKRRRRYVHGLIAEAFIGPCPKGKEVNHKNGRKSNNRPSNLEYLTRLENHRHARRLGLQRVPRGTELPQTKLTEAKARDVFRRLDREETHQSIADRHGVSRETITRMNGGLTWKHVH